MADTPPSKRLREESQERDGDVVNKKPKSSCITDILSLLEEEEEEDDSTEDLSSFMKTLEQELSPESDACGTSLSSSSSSLSWSDEEERERVMRHLLEASDDELGLPVIEAAGSDGVGISAGEYVSGEEGFDICDGLLWQLEDEAAIYYDLVS